MDHSLSVILKHSLIHHQDAADTVMSKKNQEYYHGGALDGISRDSNIASFKKCRIVPRILRDVSRVSPQTQIFGVESALPIYISPASNALLGHPEGELNLTRGVSRHGRIDLFSILTCQEGPTGSPALRYWSLQLRLRNVHLTNVHRRARQVSSRVYHTSLHTPSLTY